jgi:uroporphyrinogen decarboxylase
MGLSHRERVITALNHQQPDRCPMQISFTPEFARKLSAEMDGEQKKNHNPHGGGNTYELERWLDEDMLLTSVGWANCYYQTFEPGQEYTDEWGIRWKACEYSTRFGNGIYTEIVGHPLADNSAVSQYRMPDPCRPHLYRDAQKLIRDYKKEYFIVGVTVTTIFETAWALRGLDRLLMDMVLEPDVAEAILEIPYQYHLAAAKELTTLGVDMIWIGDDVGAQHNMIISPSLWRKFFKPKMARFISEIKAINKDLKVAYHSDGNIYEILPDIIEVGVDVLNPIQPASMDPAKLKTEFGNHLCFWGSIDEQHTLPFGTPDDVAKEVSQRLATIGRQGGLIIGPTHHVQMDTPLENFWAMVHTIRQGY